MWTLLYGIAIGGGVLLLLNFTRSRNIATKWYDWLIGIVGIALLVFAVQNYAGSLAENEPAAANFLALVWGTQAIIVLAVAATLFMRRLRAA